jgi:F-type H+-transporting ATPase subunit epsilon
VVTPEGAAYEGSADHVVAPMFDGEMAFYPRHAPFVGVLGSGELRVVRTDGRTEYFFLAGGVVQVAADEVAILATSVQSASAVDAEAAREQLAAAMATEAAGEDEIEARQARIDDARARMRVAERSRVRREPTAEEILEQPV